MTIINIDASEQCYDLASNEIRAGNFPKAEKLLDKALKFYPENTKAEILLRKLKAGEFNKTSGNGTSGSDGVHRRRPATAPTKPDEPKLGEDYTQEQLEMVQKLKR
jgi:hypothetical protein